MYSSGVFIAFSYRRSQPMVKLIRTANDTMVTITTIRSSMQFLLGRWIVLHSSTVIARECPFISALSRLCSEA
jgi:hypothetical protein